MRGLRLSPEPLAGWWVPETRPGFPPRLCDSEQVTWPARARAPLTPCGSILGRRPVLSSALGPGFGGLGLGSVCRAAQGSVALCVAHLPAGPGSVEGREGGTQGDARRAPIRRREEMGTQWGWGDL